MRILYRLGQFWRMVFGRVDPLELNQVKTALTPAQMALFNQMQTGEKEHAITMFRRLIDRGENQSDLLVAALLHDVGKTRYPLNPLERTMVVLARAVTPQQAHAWGNQPPGTQGSPPGWRRPFIVAEQHAGWGAEMAHQAGVSILTETLIREHHHLDPSVLDGGELNLLNKLKIVDNDS